MPDLITPYEYSRRRGVTPSAVLKAIKSGRINLIDGKIDPAVADLQWIKNTRHPKAEFAKPKGPMIDRSALLPGSDHLPMPDTAIPPTSYDLQLARAKRETHEANIAEMRERQKAGELVELAKVHLAYTTLAAQLRAALERIPDKLAPRLAAESDEHAVHQLLTGELDQALLDMANSAQQLPSQLIEASRAD